MNKKPFLFIRTVVFVVLAFLTGWTASLWANINGFNSGLIVAFNSVGQNLFGVTYFGATEIVIPNGNGGISALQIDLVDHPPDPVRIGVFRSDTCETYAQLQIDSSGLSVVYDSDAAPSSITLDDVDLSSHPPDPCNIANVSPE